MWAHFRLLPTRRLHAATVACWFGAAYLPLWYFISPRCDNGVDSVYVCVDSSAQTLWFLHFPSSDVKLCPISPKINKHDMWYELLPVYCDLRKFDDVTIAVSDLPWSCQQTHKRDRKQYLASGRGWASICRHDDCSSNSGCLGPSRDALSRTRRVIGLMQAAPSNDIHLLGRVTRATWVVVVDSASAQLVSDRRRPLTRCRLRRMTLRELRDMLANVLSGV